MGVQFCDDCGNLLNEGLATIITCDLCGRPCKNTLPSQSTTSTSQNFPSSLRTRLTSNTKRLTAKDLENTRRIARECNKCGAKEMAWSELQLRGADEGTTILYRCVECGNAFQENN